MRNNRDLSCCFLLFVTENNTIDVRSQVGSDSKMSHIIYRILPFN